METTSTGPEIRQAFASILEGLLKSTAASRTTLRIDLPAYGLHVDDPAGEARGEGVPSLLGVTSLDQRALDTVRWLAEHHDYLVQDKCRGAVPAPPDALIDIYGVQAQMLGPIVRQGELIGWISVHENRSVRNWTLTEVDALKQGVAEAQAVLDRYGV